MNLIGQNLGQYRITEPIGAGGMASVYKAYQAGLDRYVAIKVLPAQHALTPGFKERFTREAKAVAQLSHPNILPIYDVGIHNDISYFVMKYVPGQTLKDVMGKPIPLEKVCSYIDQIAGALDHAHQSGILHRDIKPVNILIEGEWLLLADFGLAKIVEGTEALTASGSSMGTPAYVSPEQAVGKPVNHHTDIYSLGIILYEMATGRVPYSGETPMGVMFKHVYEPLPMPRQLKPDLPEAVERVILKTLAKEPKDRFDSAGELAKALREAVKTGATDTIVSTKPLAAAPAAADFEATVLGKAGATTPATSEVTPPARRQPPWLWIGLGVLVLLIVGGGLAFFISGDDFSESTATNQIELLSAEAVVTNQPVESTAEPVAEAVVAETAVAEEEVEETPEEAPVEEAVAAASDDASTPTAEPAQEAETAAATPTSPPNNTSSVPAEGRSFADVPQLSASAILGRGPINQIAVSPAGETLAVASTMGVWLYELPSLETVQLLETQDSGIQTVAWSPDGMQMAVGKDNGTVEIWDMADGSVLQTLQGHSDPAISVAWSPDGTKLAAGSESATIFVWDTADGQQVARLTGHLYEPYGLAWSPDGNQLASASRDTTIRVWDIASGGELQKLEGHLDEVTGIEWSPDGNQLLTSSNDFTIRIWNTTDWLEDNILAGHTGWVLNATWSPDGSQIASGGFDGTIRIWDAANGDELQTLEGHAHPGVIVVWSADGSRLISGGIDGSLRVWDAATGQEVTRQTGHTSILTDVAWSPNEDRLAVVGFDGNIHIWDPSSQTEIQTIPAAGEFLTSVTWSPDGMQVATGNMAGEVKLWDLASEEPSHTLTGHAGQITEVAWSPDGSQIASASWDGTVRLWDPASGAKLRELDGHEDSVNSVVWSPDGKQLASGSNDRTVGVWDVATGEAIRWLEGRTATEVYKYFYKARGTNWVQSIDWSLDGKRLAAGSSDFVARVWDAGSGAELRMLEGPNVVVSSVAWNPDSTRLASTGVEGRSNIVVWNALKDEPLYALFDHTDSVSSLDWSPDGTQLASTGNDGIVRIWDIPAP